MYFETLPDLCPPKDAGEEAVGVVWRLVRGTKVSEDHFLSHAALGKKKPETVDGCKWAACSLWTTEEAAVAKLKLPSLKGSRPIALNIPQGSGKSMTENRHVSFWRYTGFDPLLHLIVED